MRIVFRADASIDIGTGHVMRCLTLGHALVERGAECQFICRAHEGHLIDYIRDQGFQVHELAMDFVANHGSGETAHGHWLGSSQTRDAQVCASLLESIRPDWLVVDHYALDAQWERQLTDFYQYLMVIDDLADRAHVADVLLDQTLGRDATDYQPHVPSDCSVLCGSMYALLRPEFVALRPYSLLRRAQPALGQVLVTMGGVDKDNATGQVLDALSRCVLPIDCRVVVVMGPKAPHLHTIKNQALTLPFPTQILSGVGNMAQLMADSDLAIGAAGATAWERCCLGLPTLMLVLADNQRHLAEVLVDVGAAKLLDLGGLDSLDMIPLLGMGPIASNLVDGEGVARVLRAMKERCD